MQTGEDRADIGAYEGEVHCTYDGHTEEFATLSGSQHTHSAIVDHSAGWWHSKFSRANTPE